MGLEVDGILHAGNWRKLVKALFTRYGQGLQGLQKLARDLSVSGVRNNGELLLHISPEWEREDVFPRTQRVWKEPSDERGSLQQTDSANPEHPGRAEAREQTPQPHSPPSSNLLPQCLSPPGLHKTQPWPECRGNALCNDAICICQPPRARAGQRRIKIGFEEAKESIRKNYFLWNSVAVIFL